MKNHKLQILYIVNIIIILIIEILFIIDSIKILNQINDTIALNALTLIFFGNQINYSLISICFSFFFNLIIIKKWIKLNKWIIHSSIIFSIQFIIFIIAITINQNLFSD